MTELDRMRLQQLQAWRKLADEMAQVIGQYHRHTEYHFDCYACDVMEMYRRLES